jgi:hypothetical protein
MESCLQCAFRQAEHSRRPGKVCLLEIVQDDRVPIPRRQRKNRLSYGGPALPILQFTERIWLVPARGCQVDGERHRRAIAKPRAIAVHRDRSQPGGERRLAAKRVNAPEGADKCLLRHILGIGSVATEPPGQVDESRLPALNDSAEGGKVASHDARFSERLRSNRPRARSW